MAPWLLIALLAAPPETVLWRFPGPEGGALRKAVAEAGAGDLPGHRVTDAAIDEHLRAVAWPASLGCLEDASPCDDPAQAGLALVGAAARMDARAERAGDAWRVTLSRVPAGTGAPLVVEGRGESLETAAIAAVTALRGTGTLEVAVTPGDARLFLGDQPLGQGPGRYPVAPGEYRVRAEAPGFTPAEQTVKVEADRVAPVVFDLRAALGRLQLKVTPAHAQAQLDGVPLARETTEFDVQPGRHTLRAEAEGYETHEQVIEVPAGGRLDVTVELGTPREGFLSDLPPPHADTLANGFYARAALRIGSLADGDVDAGRGSGATRSEVLEFEDGHTLTGLDLAIGWRGRILTVEALGLTFAASGDDVPADLDDVPADGNAENLTRVLIRPAWVGARYPIDRFEPYAMGGLQLVLESFEIEAPESRPNFSEGEVDHRIFLIGLEVGVRYHFTSEWFATAAGAFDFLPGERGSASLVLGAGYALELPEGF